MIVLLSNQITLVRILLIPVFVLFCVYYGQGLEAGCPQEWQRWAAIITFLVAAISDGLDGWVARHWNQQSGLGTILDPIADKGLLLVAILTLSFSKWSIVFPLWFPILVITRDLVILIGYGILSHLDQKLEIQVSRFGKIATATQMVALTWVMLQWPYSLISIYIAGFFTLASGAIYFSRGFSKLHLHDHHQ